ncbi:MAG: hypothetical protein HC824_06900 [Synechococcales cyanobacterium RM1_1_8]|nr:hypothetical protein [Synechococcales cyanobacterium RM1_1_8]NJR70883.1 hypothetical protein [Synechococcales cyanobacterium CRU_2_2]
MDNDEIVRALAQAIASNGKSIEALTGNVSGISKQVGDLSQVLKALGTRRDAYEQKIQDLKQQHNDLDTDIRSLLQEILLEVRNQ